MGKVDNNPRRGSKQFWPRKRAKKIVPRIRNFTTTKETKPLAFLGYKAGMTHIQVRDNNPTSQTKSQIITIPATIIDCPPIRPLSLRFYKKTTDGLKLYVKTEEAGGTALYFVNSDTTQDELVSRNKAILYGFIF